jgi:hypothetical protein
MPNGTAFIALFPFDLIVSSDAAAPFSLQLDGRTITLYWPFWHEPSGGRRIAAVQAERIPSRPGTPFYVVPPLQLQIEVQPPENGAFANGLRLDVYGECDGPFATEFVGQVIQQFRLRTGQWWVGHAHHDGEGLVRAEYTIDEHGSLADRECRAGAVVEPRFGTERPLTREDFILTCHAIAAQTPAPPYLDILYDSLYFFIHRQDRRRALLDACIASDMAVLYQAIRAARILGKPEQVVRRVLSDRDLLVNLRRGLAELFGKQADFSLVHSDDFQLIRRLWAARGSIAHGLAPAVGTHGRREIPSQQQTAELLSAAKRLVSWLEKLPRPPARANAGEIAQGGVGGT